MCYRDRPGAEPQTCLPCRSTEVHVVEVEVKAFVEKKVVSQQGRLADRQKDAVQKFAFRWNGAKFVDRPCGLGSMRDPTRKVTKLVPMQVRVYKRPGRLARYAAAIARDADHIEVAQAVNDSIDKEVIVDPNVVMHEDKDFHRCRRNNSSIEYRRQAGAVRKSECGREPIIKR